MSYCDFAGVVTYRADRLPGQHNNHFVSKLRINGAAVHHCLLAQKRDANDVRY